MTWKITKKERNKLEIYLKEFYKYYPREKYTVFHFVRNFKRRLKDNKDAWCGVSGTTGCLSHSTRLRGNRGSLFQLYNFQEKHHNLISTWSYDFKKNLIVPSLSKIIKSGKKKVYKVVFKDGDYVKATKNHKFFVKRGNQVIELPLSDIKEGDLLVKT